jgi:hypothetical protein
LRSRRGDGTIENYRSYVQQAAANACRAWLRKQHPLRARLRNKVRYVVSHHPRLAVWHDDELGLVCGRPEWRGRAVPPSGDRFAEAIRGRLASGSSFVELLVSLVDSLAAPCRLETLVTLVADVQGLDERPRAAREGATVDVDAVPDLAASNETRLEHRTFLHHLWREIESLPPRQRAALLLNLRDEDGRSMIALFPEGGIASRAAIAATLGLSAPELDRLWPELPRDDAWIAEHLGITRRQVINLRKCARERLARRTRSWR